MGYLSLGPRRPTCTMWAAKLCLLLLPLAVTAQDCISPAKPPKGVTPLIPDDYTGITMWMEVSFTQQTYLVKEMFDTTSNMSLIEYRKENSIWFLLVNRNEGYTLSYNASICIGTSNKNTDSLFRLLKDIPFMNELEMTYLTPEATPAGPAFKFYDYIENLKSKDFLTRTGENNECWMVDRLIPCKECVLCSPDGYNDQTETYYFSVPGYQIFNQVPKSTSPLHFNTTKHSVDVLSIELTNQSMEIFAPTGLACPLPPTEKDFPEFPTIEFDAEIVLTADDFNEIYVSQMEAIRMPKYYSLQYATWTSGESDEDKYVSGGQERVIYDKEHGIVYLHTYQLDTDTNTTMKTECEKVYKQTDFKPYMPMPRFGDIDLSMFLEVPTENENTRINYLGKSKMRFVDSNVFEVVYSDVYTSNANLSKMVVSHHFTDDSLLTPLGVEIQAFVEDTRVLSLTMHMSNVRLEPKKLNTKLRVDDCYNSPDKTEFHWFQIGFATVEADDFLYVMNEVPQLKEKFLETLYHTYNLHPWRIPDVSVDFVKNEIRVNTLLLERPLINSEFEEIAQNEIAKPTNVLGIMSQTECQTRCLGINATECTAVSYCGSICSMTDNEYPSSPANILNNTDCALYIREPHQTIPVAAEVIDQLKKAVKAKKDEGHLTVELILDTPQRTVILEAQSFDDTVDFEGAFHFNKKRVPVLETSFKVAATKKGYTVGDERKSLGSLPIEDCAQACKNRQDCESFSYCADSGKCVTNPKHEVIDTETMTWTQCMIYQTKYISKFNAFPGLTIESTIKSILKTNATDEDNCAYKCITMKDKVCRSFDFCGQGNKCNLYTMHITDTSGSAEVKATCHHFSRKYIDDYVREQNNMGKGGSILSTIPNATEADCAKRCSEWPDKKTACLSFDVCSEEKNGIGECTLRTLKGHGEVEKSEKCDFFYFSAGTKALSSERHGAGAAAGISILMLAIGGAIGVLGIVVVKRIRRV